MGFAGGSLNASADLVDAAGVDPAMALALPRARTALLQHSRQDDGSPLVTLFHGAKEVVFDDPRQFDFAEMVAKGTPFLAREAADWGAIGWEEARELLTALVEEGVLVSAADTEPAAERHDHRPMPSPLPPAPMPRARSWMDQDSLMFELTGSQLDLAYLETVVPIFRTGHLFLDREGRQVGEANVFPATARIEVPTDWRGCPYNGSRYQAFRPMNVTALRAMRVHWRQMMALLHRIRAAYLDRFQLDGEGWTVGDVERLTVSVLALPSYLMLRCDAPVANGDMHPALSNLFRVTDGLRGVMHQMLFLPLHEPMKQPNTPVTRQDILDYAERNYSFHTDHGVCAGPRFMIEDFLGVILDGLEPQGGWDSELDPELEAAAGQIGPAMDYAMLGLQAYGAVFSVWPGMTRAYEDLHRLLADHAGQPGSPATDMARRFEGHFAALSDRSFLASEEWRSHREAVYDDMYARCLSAINGIASNGALSAIITPLIAAREGQPRAALVAAAAAHFGPGNEELADGFAAVIMDFIARGQKIVELAERIQAETRRLLCRPAPSHCLTLQHLNLHNVLMGDDIRTVPFLPDELASLLSIDINVDAEKIEIRERPNAASAHHSPVVTSGG